MDPYVINFIMCVGAIVGGIICLKIFFSLWGILDRRWNPGKVSDTPESAFKDLKRKTIHIVLRSGETLEFRVYEKTLFFNDGEMGYNAVVYFQVRNPEGIRQYIAGSDIVLIEESPAQPSM